MARLGLLVTALATSLGIGTALAAAEWVAYSPKRFATAQAEERKILVDVAADWCPTCRAQEPILDELRADGRLDDVVFIRVDFDVHRDFPREHRIPRQSTIIVFDGDTEVHRSIAETDRDRLRGFAFGAVGR